MISLLKPNKLEILGLEAGDTNLLSTVRKTGSLITTIGVYKMTGFH